MVSPSMPNAELGKFHTIRVMSAVTANKTNFLMLKSPDKTSFSFSCII